MYCKIPLGVPPQTPVIGSRSVRSPWNSTFRNPVTLFPKTLTGASPQDTTGDFRYPDCPELGIPLTSLYHKYHPAGYQLENKKTENQNSYERSPGQWQLQCQFSVQKVKGHG